MFDTLLSFWDTLKKMFGFVMFSLRPLPFEMEALEPVISARTVTHHYTKHHNGYVQNLNAFVKDSDLERCRLVEVIQKSAERGNQDPKSRKIFNNAAQVWNHDFYWASLSPNVQERRFSTRLSQAIGESFGSYDDFLIQFKEKAVGQFGSGWAWLVSDLQGKVSILTTSNAQVPWLEGSVLPLLVIDVWEHAYYLDFQERRAAYLEGILAYLNGTFASVRYEALCEKAQGSALDAYLDIGFSDVS